MNRKTNLKEKLISGLLSAVLAFTPIVSASPLVLAQEVTPTETIDPNDPNNWYELWKAERDAMDAQLAAANSTTGADSTNTTDTTSTAETDANLTNDGQVVNIASGEAVTGDSDANRNTGDASITSGDASLTAEVGSNINQVSIGGLDQGTCNLIGCAASSDSSASNSDTGAGSENNASVEENSDSEFIIDNDLDIVNEADFTANSGSNNASRNTGDATIETGDADLGFTAINVGNNVNVGAQVFNIYDDQTGDIVLNWDNVQVLQTASNAGQSSTNDNTGADSENNATTTSDNNTTIVINNDGSISNDYVLNAITGQNDADRNTGDASITTGDANVAANVINFLNNTFLGGTGELLLGIVNVFGNLTGNIIVNPPTGGSATITSPESLNAANATTGADSTNNANVESNNNLQIGVANTASVLNGIDLFANTGSNDASLNTGSGTVQTGDIDSQLKTTTIANTTTVGGDGTLWLVLVNNMGTWTGQLMGLDVNGVASPFFSFVVGPDGSLMAVNDTTGADSTNNATTTNNNSTDIAVNNNGTVNNNLVINADTGHNSATRNTGNANITTGDVNVAANVMNILNNTFIGQRMVITIVNVFGGFFGNVITPGSGSAATEGETQQAANNASGTNLAGQTAQGASGGGNSSNTGSSTSNSNTGSASQNQSLVLSASDNFGTPKITKVVSENSSGLNLRNIIFTLILSAASAQIILKLGRRGWLIRKR